MGSKKKSGKQKKNKSSKRYLTIAQHKQQGKTLIPPMLTIPNVNFASWMNDRLSNLLWATLVVSQLERRRALELFREIATYARKLEGMTKEIDITHTGIAKFDTSTIEEILEILCQYPEVRTALRPLGLLEELPARENWLKALKADPEPQDWDILKLAVAKTLDHQSEEATDCRWLRVCFQMLAGKLRFPPSLEEVAKEIFYYPDYGEIEAVRPTVRSAEGALAVLGTDELEWPARFWKQCMRDSECKRRERNEVLIPVAGTNIERINDVYDLLIKHANETRTTTGVDARHDAIFGFAFYALEVLRELLGIGVSTAILGRTGLRALVECFITLSYLTKKNDLELWRTYRIYGSGQAKLAFLKLDELDTKLSYVDIETLEQLANEDIWQEYLPINLGHWEKSNLRAMSDIAEVKTEYDKYYSWTSGYMHGQWAAVRDSVFETCMNPLHRLHRIPRARARMLNDAVPDSCYLADKILEIVSTNYPSFSYRATLSA